MRMLLQLNKQLNWQGIDTWVSGDVQLSCKLCDICYLLVIAGHELSEVELKVAKALNIPVPREDGTP